MTQSIRWLQDEIADRMLQKLDIVKLEAKDLLLIPDFPGAHLQFLAKRFPNASIHSAQELDASKDPWRLRVSRFWRSVFKKDTRFSLEVYLKTGRIDLPNNSVDLTFSYLGPDTGKELGAELPVTGIQPKKLASPWDMHDMGDALLGVRFADPVMDMELLHLDYESPKLLIDDAVNLGLIEKPAASASTIGDLPNKLTLELVYGHAWAVGKHLAKAQNQLAYIDVNQIGRKTRSDSA